MIEEKVSCSRCNRPILGMSHYCCDPIQSFCSDCSRILCRKCYRPKTKVKHNERIVASRVVCVNCGGPEIKAKCEYFFESKCKQYYCPACLMLFYQNYCKMIEKFEKQHGSTLEMLVEVRCGCELEKNVLIDYLRKYCELCNRRIEGNRCIQLANRCRVMASCYENFTKDYKNEFYSKERRKELKQLFAHIQRNIMRCENCKLIIDGERQKLGENIDGVCICMRCLVIAKEAEAEYSKGSEKKEKKKQQKKEGPLQLQCQQCFAIIREKINGSCICRTCYDHLDKAGKKEQIEEHPKQSKIKPVNKHEIVKVPPMIEIEKQEKAEVVVPVKQPAIKNMENKKNKAQNSIKIENIEENEIPPSQKNESLSPPSVNLPQKPQNEEFYKPSAFKLKIAPLKQELKECGECGCRIQKENCFNAYQQDPGIEKTLRIAETQKEISKYSQEGMLKVYCKVCYMDVKIRQKLFLKRIARQAEQRRPAVRGLSQPKPLKNQFHSPLQASKYQREDDRLQKKLDLMGTAPQRFGLLASDKPRPKEPYISTTICHRCSKYVPLAEYDSFREKCRDCEADEIERQLRQKQKKEQAILRRKCEKCKKMYTAKMSEQGKYKRCSSCTADLLGK